MKELGFIGCGNMGSAILNGTISKLSPDSVIVFDKHPEKLAPFKDAGCKIAFGAAEAAENAKLILLCVKPQAMDAALDEIIPVLSKNNKEQVLVSIAAGLPVSYYKNKLEKAGISMPVIRVMPNMPAMTGDGVMLVCAEGNVPPELSETLNTAFSGCGSVEYVSEHFLDIGTAVSGCAPAFAAMFIESLADGAVECGLPRSLALRLAEQTTFGTAAMLCKTGMHPDVLKDAVCSPGGSTIKGVASLEKLNFRAAVSGAVVASNNKNMELGKK